MGVSIAAEPQTVYSVYISLDEFSASLPERAATLLRAVSDWLEEQGKQTKNTLITDIIVDIDTGTATIYIAKHS